jgi:hypothetical protein
LSTHGLTFQSGSTFDVEITSASNSNGFDKVIVAGSVSIATTGGGVTLRPTAVGTLNLQDGQQLRIIDNDNVGTLDAVNGTFAGLPDGAKLGSNFLGSGLTATISYKGFNGTDNDVVLSMSPGSPFPWHNFGTLTNDVAGSGTSQPDGSVDANDVITIINYINSHGSGPIPDNAVIGFPFGFLDTKADNQVVAEDVVTIINYINAGRPFGGEAPQENETPVEPSFNLPFSGTAISPVSDDLLFLLATDIASQSTPRRAGRT